MTEYRETNFIPADWVERAAWWPGLQVYSRPICIPVDASHPERRKTDPGSLTLADDEIERLLQAALFPDESPFESVDLNHVENLLAEYDR